MNAPFAIHDESVNSVVIFAAYISGLPWDGEVSAILHPDETQRMNRFVFERDRMRFGRVRAWLRTVIGVMLSIEPAAIHLQYDSYGKPHLCSTFHLHFNISHCDDVALLALSRHPVGVDIERIKQNCSLELIAREQFTPTEQLALRSASTEPQDAQFLSVWTRKEAVLKGMGYGLSVPLADIDTGIPTVGPTTVLNSSQTPIGWYVRAVPLPATHVASIATPWREGNLSLFWPRL